jgi:poly(A) polymerase Pap1
MDKNSVIFKIYKNENGERVFAKDYIFNLSMKIIEIKSIILKELFNNEYNGLDLDNINERVYKDFGKLFFDKGLIPSTIDNYKLGDFTNGSRTFEFVVFPKNITIEKKDNSNELLKKIIKEERNKKEFVIYDDDFPPLVPIKNK